MSVCTAMRSTARHIICKHVAPTGGQLAWCRTSADRRGTYAALHAGRNSSNWACATQITALVLKGNSSNEAPLATGHQQVAGRWSIEREQGDCCYKPSLLQPSCRGGRPMAMPWDSCPGVHVGLPVCQPQICNYNKASSHHHHH